MLEAIVMSTVLARGPDLPVVKETGEKHHPSSVSMYQGDLYVKKHNSIRLCIRDRESNDIYSAVSKPPNTYRGAYQMNDSLIDGAAWMIQKQLRSEGYSLKQARKIRKEIHATKGNQISIYWQDRIFWTIWGEGEGRMHWYHTVPGTACF
jgi:hypothetical protein